MIKNMERRTFLEATIATMPLAALGQSSTPQTSAQTTKIEALIEQRKLRRKVHGIAANLLPFAADRQVAVEAFQNQLVVTHHAGLMNAVSMDTSYVNYLSETGKSDVLRWTREALDKDVPFVSGAYIEGQSGDAVPLYRRELDVIIGEGEGGDLSRGAPGISAGAGFRAGQDVCAERRNF
jgi:hypothetical protein